jgi:hypothetical protein
MSWRKLKPLQQKSFLDLLSGFVLLDREFCEHEEEYLTNFFAGEGIEVDDFYDLLENNIKTNSSPRAICETALSEMRNLQQSLKEWILEKLYELSVSDDFLHVDEKIFLEDVNRYWGIRTAFGKGNLVWTDEQKIVIEAEASERIIVTARPGAGKTAVACAKISNLIDAGVPSSNIWLLSFTRTAVQELRDRIASFASEEESILGVKIATIDSRAWSLRFGMRDEKGASIFQTYDLAIEAALKLLEEQAEEMEDFFDSLEHVIIDEAQDITGVRLQLILKLLQLIPNSCGVTIFGDAAQAIYGFTSDDQDQNQGQNLIEIFKNSAPLDFHSVELNSMHRTENTNLVDLLDRLRIAIQVEDVADVIAPSDTVEAIKLAASKDEGKFEAKKLVGLTNTLILFRRRADVLQATNFASQENIPFRVRMSGLPIICRPWIGQLFFDYDRKSLSDDEFRSLWASKETDLIDCGDTVFSAQKRLFDETFSAGRLDLIKLRNLISNRVPPVNLCLQDLGLHGPILGTIHASKGRQAENVQLFMSPDYISKSTPEQLAEESRVLFVGSSRAQNDLTVGRGFRSFGRNLKSGRTYIRNKRRKNAAQTEIGRADDYDVYSLVHSKNISDIDAKLLQTKLADFVMAGTQSVVAKQNTDDDYVYDLFVQSDLETWVGQFSKSLNSDLFNIKSNLEYSQRRGLPTEIRHLKLVGLSTVASSEAEDPTSEARNLTSSFQNSGIWCVPIITGFPTIFF